MQDQVCSTDLCWQLHLEGKRKVASRIEMTVLPCRWYKATKGLPIQEVSNHLQQNTTIGNINYLLSATLISSEIRTKGQIPWSSSFSPLSCMEAEAFQLKPRHVADLQQWVMGILPLDKLYFRRKKDLCSRVCPTMHMCQEENFNYCYGQKKKKKNRERWYV